MAIFYYSKIQAKDKHHLQKNITNISIIFNDIINFYLNICLICSCYK